MTDKSVKFALKEALVSLAATIIICAILFAVIVNGESNLAAMAVDVPITVACTGLICVVLQIFMRKGAVKKGAVPPMGDMSTQVAYALIPQNSVVFVIYITLITLLLFAFAPLGILAALSPDIVIGKAGYVAFKAVLAGLASGYSTFHGIVFFCAEYQKVFAQESN